MTEEGKRPCAGGFLCQRQEDIRVRELKEMTSNHLSFKRVLVTGGLGFIGSAIAERYLRRGTTVTVVDSKLSNVLEPRELESKYETVRVIEAPVASYFADADAMAKHDLCVHAASVVGPAAVLGYAGSLAEQIVTDTARIVNACVRCAKPLIYFSSAEVYGKSGILREDGDIRVPPYYNARIEYALGKLASEAVVLNSHVRGLHSAVIRSFNVVGPFQSRAGGFVVPTFVQQALGNRPLTVFGTGAQQRAFLGVNDLAEFVVDYVGDGVLSAPRIFNVGNPGNGSTIMELARRVIELVKTSNSSVIQIDPRSVYGPLYHEAESFVKLPALKNATELGWRPKQALGDIILETVEYYRSNYDRRGADARN